jgi:site-specific DNA-methyltransferase (adenine-specific)
MDSATAITPEAKQWQGWGTALKPALEPIVVARKPLIGTVAENVLTHGTGGLNIDASRIGYQNEADRDSAMPGSTPPTEIASGHITVLSGTRQAHDPKTGRWPANLILDEYTAELLDEQSGQLKSGKLKPDAYQKERESDSMFAGAGVFDHKGYEADSGGASRFFYVAKASKRDRNEGLEDLQERQAVGGGGGVGDYLDDVNSASGKFGSEKAPAKNFHPTVKPTALMQYLVKLVTPPGGTVLDPFTGSGSTGKAAILEGFDFIGIELTEDYWPIIEGRLKHAEAKVAEAKENQEAQPQGLF